jgi:hypothetical protein
MNAAITYRINKELKFLYKEKHLHASTTYIFSASTNGPPLERRKPPPPLQMAKTCSRLRWLQYDKFTHLYMYLLVISHTKSSVHGHESFEIKKIHTASSMTSGFGHNVDEICILLGYYAV